MSTRFDRRTFLQAAGRLALFAGLAPAARVWASAPFPAYPFLLGVALWLLLGTGWGLAAKLGVLD